MDQSTLVTEQFEIGARFINELDKRIPVSIAFWLQEAADDRWHLYAVSEKINDTNLKSCYEAVFQASSAMREPKIDPFQVRLISPRDPIAKDVLAIERHPRIPTRVRRIQLGGLPIEEAYIYPSGGNFSSEKRRTRVFGKREEFFGAETRAIEEEIGSVDALPMDDGFPQAFRNLIVSRFGTIENFVSRYSKGFRIEYSLDPQF